MWAFGQAEGWAGVDPTATDGISIGAGKFATTAQFTKLIAIHAAIGGITAELQGGKFGHGFISAGVVKSFAAALAKIDTNWKVNGKDIPQAMAAAVLGGTVSKASGGKFSNGAITGAFQNLYNQQSGAQKRGLSEGEREAALKAHPDFLESELDKIKIDFSLDMECSMSKGNCGGFTPYSEINLPAQLAGCADLTICGGGANYDLFVHELTHAWMNINTSNPLGLSGSIRGFIFGGLEAKPTGGYLTYDQYKNTPLPAGLNSEKMADWFMWKEREYRGL